MNGNKYIKSKTKKKYKYYNKEKSKKTIFLLNSTKVKQFKKHLNKNKKSKLSEIKPKKGRNIFMIFSNIISFLLFIVAYYFYYLSLDKCFEGEDVCSKKWDWILLNIIRLVISSVIIIFLFILIIYKIISKIHLLHFIAIFICFYKYSNLAYFHDHGGYNLLFLILSLFISLILLLLIKLISLIFRIKYKYKLVLILIFLSFYNVLVDPMNCDDWGKGLNNTYLENNRSKHGCSIKFPKKCQYKVFTYTLDLSLLSHVSCSNKKKKARENILKFSKSPYINQNTMKFGFPLTNNDEGLKDGKDNTILTVYTSKNLIDMDQKLPQELPKPEYIVDFSKDSLGELIINLNYNESLSKERKILEKNSIPYSNNILILYFDSVSRVHALRKLKKTLNFFEQFISYKGGHHKNYPNENFHSFQFFKYHAHEAYTLGNFPKLLYGNKIGAKDFVRINKYLKQNGYVTGYASDVCQKDYTRTRHNLQKDALYDHQFLLCDPNADGENSSIKRCLYGNLNAYYLHEYINQFWRKYPNNRKFGMITCLDGHEGTLELLKYTDDVIYNFLNSLYNDNLLKDTSVFLESDHGCSIPSVYYLYDFFLIEKRLPMLFIIVNDRKNIDYNQQYFNIQKNQQAFITAYDIYNTIGYLAYGDNYTNIPKKNDKHDTPRSQRGESLFDVINSKDRSPKNYIYMSRKFCI